MTEREIIEGAIRLLRQRGWHQGSYQGRNGELCAFGALSDTFNELCQARRLLDDNRRWEAAWRTFLRAKEMVCEAADTDLSLPNWNDQEGRTVGEVLDAMERAARSG